MEGQIPLQLFDHLQNYLGIAENTGEFIYLEYLEEKLWQTA